MLPAGLKKADSWLMIQMHTEEIQPSGISAHYTLVEWCQARSVLHTIAVEEGRTLKIGTLAVVPKRGRSARDARTAATDDCETLQQSRLA